MGLSNRQKWLLVLIGSTKYVEGNTRLQKYGLLIHNRIPKLENFYNDWASNKYGVFSPDLALDLQKFQQKGFVNANKVTNRYGKEVNRYEISNDGRDQIKDLIEEQKDVINAICGITQYYFQKSLKELLADVYSLYPEFTTRSQIKPEVNQKTIELNSFLSPEFEIPFDAIEKLESDISNLYTKSTQEHLFNDEDFRESLARKIGLKEVPKLDPNAFDRLSGIFEDEIKLEKTNSVELIRTVRGS